LFPNFATKEKCESIIALARRRLHPSALALRKGETADSTKDIRTSSGTFLRANEDKTGALDWVEERMARATMIPRAHGEVCLLLHRLLVASNSPGPGKDALVLLKSRV
jgi:prolyl 4-hydroxylase